VGLGDGGVVGLGDGDRGGVEVGVESGVAEDGVREFAVPHPAASMAASVAVTQKEIRRPTCRASHA
jgi:hypothetical protein